jgi:hypothetical protein
MAPATDCLLAVLPERAGGSRPMRAQHLCFWVLRSFCCLGGRFLRQEPACLKVARLRFFGCLCRGFRDFLQCHLYSAQLSLCGTAQLHCIMCVGRGLAFCWRRLLACLCFNDWGLNVLRSRDSTECHVFGGSGPSSSYRPKLESFESFTRADLACGVSGFGLPLSIPKPSRRLMGTADQCSKPDGLRLHFLDLLGRHRV